MTSQGMVGERIKAIRRQRGLSQAQLAHPELSDSYVSLIESGKRTPTPAVLELLAQKLDCSLTYLVNGVTAEQMEELELGLRFARMALDNGELVEARRRFAELLQDSHLTGLASLRQDARYGYALAAEACGDLPDAISVLTALRTDDAEGQSQERRVQVALALCRCYRELGDLQAAAHVGEGSLGLGVSRPVWDDGLMELGSTLLSVYIERGDLLRARQFATELLTAAEELGTPRALVAALWNAAVTIEKMGSGEEALPLIERALAIHSENGDPRNLARLRASYGMMLLRTRPEEAPRARDLCLRSLRELRESSAGVAAVTLCLTYVAQTEIASGRIPDAMEHALEARESDPERVGNVIMAEVHLILGQLYWLQERDADCLAELALAKQLLEQLPATRKAAETWQAIAEITNRAGDQGLGTTAYQRALACVGL
ncbi:XRE family transcriptional regulator [Microbispora sp. ATCC PTA-5024]|nr:XRE family transcriptional regulator [Microbispora sp. ATCC PTA-5024]